jgi:hypothetical protein
MLYSEIRFRIGSAGGTDCVVGWPSDCDGYTTTCTRQITGGKDLLAVKQVLREALEDLGEYVAEVLK